MVFSTPANGGWAGDVETLIAELSRLGSQNPLVILRSRVIEFDFSHNVLIGGSRESVAEGEYVGAGSEGNVKLISGLLAVRRVVNCRRVSVVPIGELVFAGQDCGNVVFGAAAGRKLANDVGIPHFRRDLDSEGDRAS